MVENLAIMITEKCNQNCYHCFRPVTRLPSALSMETLSILSDKITGSSIKNVRFTGGEPLLIPEFARLVNSFASKGFSVSVGTNATLLNKEKVSHLKESGLEEVWTTIHSCNPKNHDQLAGCKGAFDLTVSAIKECIHAGIRTCVNFPVSKYNLQDLKTTLSFLMSLGIDRTKVLRITPMGKAGSQTFDHLSEDEWREVIGMIAEMDTDGHDIKVQGCEPLSHEDGKCYIYPIRHLNINPLGKVFPCCLLNNRNQYEVGSVAELLTMDFKSAIDLFNSRIRARSVFSEGTLPCLDCAQGKDICPLYSRHTMNADRIRAND